MGIVINELKNVFALQSKNNSYVLIDNLYLWNVILLKIQGV